MSDSAKSTTFVKAMTSHIKSGGEFAPHCDNSGVCMALDNSSTISNCFYCGKELHWKDGSWWTWDADLHDTKKPQNGMPPNDLQ